MTNYVIIGNGAAGTTAAEHIRKQDPEGKITILTDEDLSFYWRIQLPEYISGDKTEEGLIAKEASWYKDLSIDLKLGTRVEKADPDKKTVISHDGGSWNYDRLLLATGSHSFIPPIEGSDKRGVFALRSIQDAREISTYAKGLENVILIGGGLLGLEAGNALRKAGKRVMVVEFFPRLLPRQLDVEGAQKLQDILEDMGFSFRLGAKTQAITGEDRVDGIRLEEGEILEGGMVIISAGVRPNLELAQGLGLETDKGIKVDERLQASRDGIYAAGDVAEFKGMPYGIWPAAMEQGEIAGINMAGGDRIYEGTTMATALKVVGVDLASAGEIDADGNHESRVLSEGKVYKKVVFEEGRIIGCIMLGDTKNFNKIKQLMGAKKDVSEVKDELLSEGLDFGRLDT
jgi:nitrite reductase (NADH) large subunit